jgi:hypothetical protein
MGGKAMVNEGIGGWIVLFGFFIQLLLVLHFLAILSGLPQAHRALEVKVFGFGRWFSLFCFLSLCSFLIGL